MKDLMGRLGNNMFQFAFLYAQARDGQIPDVFLQSPTFFKKYQEEIRAMYSEGITSEPYVAIHIRRGDYIDNPFYIDLTKTDYYQRAIEMFPDSKFLVFSDDPLFAKEFFGEEDKFIFAEKGDEVDDLNLMASCSEGIIMANSSFSWWGAFLGNPNKKVIYPKNWFTDGKQRVGFLDNWTAI